jgi:hypothetical protein
MNFSYDPQTMSRGVDRFRALSSDADTAFFFGRYAAPTYGGQSGLIGLLAFRQRDAYEQLRLSLYANQWLMSKSADNIQETLSLYTRSEDAATASVTGIYDELGDLSKNSAGHLDNPKSYEQPWPGIGVDNVKHPPVDLSVYSSRLPASEMRTPAPPEYPVLRFLELLFLGGDAGGSVLAKRLLAFIGFPNLLSDVTKTLFGDWAAVHVNGQAYDSLAHYWATLSGQVRRDAGHLLTTWKGDAATQADVYFTTLSTLLIKPSNAAVGAAQALESCADGVRMLAAEVDSLIGSIFEIADAIGTCVDVITTANLATVWELLRSMALAASKVLARLVLIVRIVHATIGAILSLAGLFEDFRNELPDNRW